ncbi:MAG: type ISP restriction/modification enzyme [Chitinophagales bacterium]
MSLAQIANYHRQLEKTQRRGTTSNEQSIKGHFANLLQHYCNKKDLTLIAERHYENLRPDGTVRGELFSYGYWESKDTKDDLEQEIKKKIAKGYPTNNIIFEDSQTAVLYQYGKRIAVAKTIDEQNFDELLNTFVEFELPIRKELRKAIQDFKENIPKMAKDLRQVIKKEEESKNKKFVQARSNLIEICKQSINPEITKQEVNEMLVQHILTEDMFLYIFSETEFHRENNIAQAIDKVLKTFYTKKRKREVKNKIGNFYTVLKAKVSNINILSEKQKILKMTYEEFYKAYNPKGADRLGVVYTPNEIVDFMIESTDYLCREHFGKGLADKGVQILDPATGTGTFVTSLLDFIPKHKRKEKYLNEIHCNELAILPYYIANLNIEYTYNKLMNEYEPFENIVLADTLEIATQQKGSQSGLFTFSEENTDRIKKQINADISVIIGNPPYNAKQQNFNDQNANRKYTEVDKRIKATFVKQGTAQNQNVLYGMYVRFYRWAIDRLQNEGIVAFVTNNSFINKKTFDGFRKCVADMFNEVWLIDFKGDARTSGEKRKSEGGNVFDDKIRVGVCIAFFIKKKTNKSFLVHYSAVEDYLKKDAKINFIKNKAIYDLPFETIKPSEKNNWIDIAGNNFDELIPLMDKDVKRGKSKEAVFKLFSTGVGTSRDEWIYNFNKKSLKEIIFYFVETYNNLIQKNDLTFPNSIKWSSSLKTYFKRKLKVKYNNKYVILSNIRPFIKKFHYAEKIFNHRLTSFHYQMLGKNLNKRNLIISFEAINAECFVTLASNSLVDYAYLKTGNGGTQSISFYTYDENGKRSENITDWGLAQFTEHYKDTSITKLDIFHYTYGVLHNPQYREKYELNLKREFPRLPFYKDFQKWASWGRALMSLHIEYETAEPYALQQIDKKLKKGTLIVPKLKANKEEGIIILDSKTELHGVPSQAWTYKLGNRSALEWILDQYKEKKIRDATIREKFNTYRFADYKKQVIDLLKRVCTVSVETMKIVGEMKGG